MRLGCCIDCLEKLPIVAEVGYDFVDLAGSMLSDPRDDMARIKNALADAELPAVGVHASLPPSLRLTGDKVNLQALRNYLALLTRNASQLGIQWIGVGSPRSRQLPPGFSPRQADLQMTDALLTACLLAPPPLGILLESLHPGETNYINDLSHAYRLVQQVGHPQCGLLLDCYHFQMTGERSDELTPRMVACVEYLHIADPEGRAFPSKNTTPELFTLIRCIRALGYNGDIAVEAVSSQFEQDAREALTVLREKLDDL